MWSTHVPELAIAANAVSLLMPHAEPYVVASVRSALDDLTTTDPELAADAQAYAAQEAQHHGQHRAFNEFLLARYPRLARIDRIEASIFRRLRARSGARSGTRSAAHPGSRAPAGPDRFGLAFAAGFETIAFVAARWVDRHQRLLHDAEPTVATFFLWHLAEEVEHKEVAYEVYEAAGGGRLRYAAAMAVAAVVLAASSMVATLVMLAAEGRLLSPVAHWRLLRWSLGFVLAALPVMVVSALPGHHPRDLADPVGLEHWLDHLDPATSTVPPWALP